MSGDGDLVDELARQRPPTPAALSATLEAELGAIAPVAPRRPRRQLALLGAISLIYGSVVLALLALRRDLAELPAIWIVGAGLAWLLGFAVPCYLALVPRAGSVMSRRTWAAASTIVTSTVFVAFGLVIHPDGPSSAHHGWEHAWRGHTCLEIGLATALVPVVAGALFLRGASPVGSRWIAAALGAGGAGIGGLVLHLHCHVADAVHVGVVHGGVVVVAALLSAALVPKLTDRAFASG